MDLKTGSHKELELTLWTDWAEIQALFSFRECGSLGGEVEHSPHSPTVAKLCFRTALIALWQKCLGPFWGNTSQALREKSWLIRIVRANLATAVLLIITASTCSLCKKMWVENVRVELSFFLVFVCVCGGGSYTHAHACRCLQRPEGLRYLGTALRDGCELSDGVLGTEL